MSHVTVAPQFGHWRSLLWPIHHFELKKVIPMLLMFFCINFNYSALRALKDGMALGGKDGSSGNIAMFKLFGVLPAAMLFMTIYPTLKKNFRSHQIFYGLVSSFILFFMVFSYWIWPHNEVLVPLHAMDWLKNHLPSFCKSWIDLLRVWPAMIFYIMAELWGSIALSFLFWGFANDTTRLTESRRFYSLFGMAGCFSPMAVMYLIQWFKNVIHIHWQLPDKSAEGFVCLLNMVTAAVSLSGVGIIAIYYFLNNYVLTDPKFALPEEVQPAVAKKQLSLRESLTYLINSRYFLCVALLVTAYGASMQLMELIYKEELRVWFHADSKDISVFTSKVQCWTSCFTLFMMLFVGGNTIRLFGWRIAALMTPTIMAITSLFFFGCLLFQPHVVGFAAVFGTDPLGLTVFFGVIQAVLGKGTKYSLFDPTKEMLYLPFDKDTKRTGKAAVDVMAARFGKSTGAAFNLLFTAMMGSLLLAGPYVALVAGLFLILWFVVVNILSVEFSALTANKTVSV